MNLPRAPHMNPPRTADSSRPLFWSWLESHEFQIALILALATGLIGYFFERSPTPILIAAFELVVGLVLWATRRIGKEIELLREDLALHNDVFCHATMLGDPQVMVNLCNITESLTRLAEHQQLQGIAKYQLEELASRFRALAAGSSIPIYGRLPSQLVQDTFMTHMRYLPECFRYDTLTNLRFWSTEVTHNPEGFLHDNVTLARNKDGRIRRVFLLERMDLDADEISILQKHKLTTEKNKPYMETRVLVLEKAADLDLYGNFGICKDKSGPTLLLTVHYTHGDNKFERVDLVREQREIEKHQDLFTMAYEQAQPIGEFLGQSTLKRTFGKS